MTIWLTEETPPRVLFVKGRSAMDPDCLVAHAEGSTKPLWIVDDGATKERAYVCGLGGDVYARPVKQPDT